MKLTFIPSRTPSRRALDIAHADNLVIVYRKGEAPRIAMRNVTTTPMFQGRGTRNASTYPHIAGDFVDGFSLSELQDGDVIFYPMRDASSSAFVSEAHVTDDIVLPFTCENCSLSIADGFSRDVSFALVGRESERTVEHAITIAMAMDVLYTSYPMYRSIMLNENNVARPYTLIELIRTQSETFRNEAISAFVAVGRSVEIRGAIVSLASRILERVKVDASFSLLTQEDQVSAFIEFSRKTASSKHELVSDELLDKMRNSEEYAHVMACLAQHGMGISTTQQFNILQQVGYMSTPQKNNSIMYNLSDMGAGKTLMTVESIFLLDLKKVSAWLDFVAREDTNVDHFRNIYVPDKHIIAPTLSVKSSWIDTFRKFYEVTEVDEFTYKLSFTFRDQTVTSTIYVAPFTVRNGQLYVGEKLPMGEANNYLIIDEVHQLVQRQTSKTKFFPSNITPCNDYHIFVVSGTLSNLTTSEWQNYLRFIGRPLTPLTPAESRKCADEQQDQYARDLAIASRDILYAQRRQFDVTPIAHDELSVIERDDKLTSVAEAFYSMYSPQIVRNCRNRVTYMNGEAVMNTRTQTIEEYIDDVRVYPVPKVYDAPNFQLFYSIVGSQAITAQSLVVAEELFGEQKTQHISDIIKTKSSLSANDIEVLRLLHNIAQAHTIYKSANIARAINTAILNLNDGLQNKNIYEIISKYAENNVRFLEYLAGLDVDILERLEDSSLIQMPKLEETEKFAILQDILANEPDETHLIVVNDYDALQRLSKAIGINYITRKQLVNEIEYQETLDALFQEQSVVVVTQSMIKSSLDLVQANRLIQYQLNTEISDIIQTQNRINRIGQTRETRGYYIASDALQENLVELFVESYRNIRVAHRGIVELFVDVTSQINVVSDYVAKALKAIPSEDVDATTEVEVVTEVEATRVAGDIVALQAVPEGLEIVSHDALSPAILYPLNDEILVVVQLSNKQAFSLGTLASDKASQLSLSGPTQATLNLNTYALC